MRVLVDIAHPAHVHFFKNIVWGLIERGHQTSIVGREKDVTCGLLDHYGFEYATVGCSRRRGRIGQLGELLHRDWALWRLARDFRPDVIVTRNPAGVQVARLARAVGIFDTDDGRAAGVHFRAAVPFAHYITTPDCLQECYGKKHVKYSGYKQFAYLHPDQFSPDPAVLKMLGVEQGEPFFIVRFVAMIASHDKSEGGLPFEAKQEIVRQLAKHGKVFITSEAEMPDELALLQIPVPPHLLHDALAFATLQVGDSQTMAAEAAVLGIPSVRASTFVGRICYLEELEHRYGLSFGFHPQDVSGLLGKLRELLDFSDLRASFGEKRAKLLSEKKDIAKWFVDFIETCAPARRH